MVSVFFISSYLTVGWHLKCVMAFHIFSIVMLGWVWSFFIGVHFQKGIILFSVFSWDRVLFSSELSNREMARPLDVVVGCTSMLWVGQVRYWGLGAGIDFFVSFHSGGLEKMK